MPVRDGPRPGQTEYLQSSQKMQKGGVWRFQVKNYFYNLHSFYNSSNETNNLSIIINSNSILISLSIHTHNAN